MARVTVSNRTGNVTIIEDNGKKTKFIKMSDAVNFCIKYKINAFPSK